MEKLPYYHLFTGKSHEPAVELAEKIKALAPGRMARVFYQTSGSEANDTQVKFAWYYNNALGRPAKKKIISRQKAYHGVTIVAASLTGLPNSHRDFDLPVAGIRHLSDAAPLEARRAGRERGGVLGAAGGRARGADPRGEGPDTVAAFIAEPVMGAGGVIVPPEGYFPAIAAVCRRHDVLMISDEVICGFGRTGAWFGAQALDFEPTSISMAKQLTAGFLPLSAVAIDGEMAEVIEANSGRIGTLGPRLHLRRAPGRLRGGGEGAGDLRAHGRPRARARAGPALRGAPPPARGASAGGRGARPRPDGRRSSSRPRGPGASPSRARSGRGSPPSWRRAA